jgi:hypothetical protein
MTPSEALEEVARAGVTLEVNPVGQLVAQPRGRLASQVQAALVAHKSEVVALLRLRLVWLSMGFDDTDLTLLERAMLSGQDDTILVPPPKTLVA